MSSSYGALEQVKVSIPGADDPIYKDECAYTFTSPESEDGLYVSLYSFIGLSKEYAIEYANRTSHKAFLHIKRTRGKVDCKEEKTISRLAIGIEGGFASTGTHTMEENVQIVILPEGAVFNVDDPKLPASLMESVQKVLKSDSAYRKEELQATSGTWDGEARKPSKHSATLIQISNGKKIPPSGWKCSKCDAAENLWLNLADGSINCGRAFFNGTGGKNHSLEHYNETKYPLVVKLGTITSKGADVYSYEEDDMVIDSNLSIHLSHFGINMEKMQQTEKSMTELELDLNQKVGEWAICTEENRDLSPVYGPGYTGLVNLGNSCYLNSVVQLIFNLPVFIEKYVRNYEKMVPKIVGDPYTDLSIQVAKLGYAIHSGAHSKIPVNEGDSSAIRPQCFKNVVGKSHPEFGSKRQQDAEEYFCHLLTLLDREQRNNPVSNAFTFEVEERLLCGKTGTVAYKKRKERVFRLPVPMERAINRTELDACEKRKKEAEMKNEKLSADDDVLARLDMAECLSQFFASESVSDYYSPAAKEKVTVFKTTKFLTFPEYLLIQIRKFTLGEDWSPKKLGVSLQVPDILDLNEWRSKGGIQPGEQEMPQEERSSPVVDEALVLQLVEMGFPVEGCKKAVFHSENGGVEAAMQWVMDHMGDSDFSEPFVPPGTSTSTDGGSETIDEANVQTIMAMGFSHQNARKALIATGNNLERALDWIFSHQDELEEHRPEEQASVPLPDGGGKYCLSGFITHMGPNTASGHYVCHLWKDGRWIICNDEKISISEKPPRDLAYLYLYKRVQ